MEQRQKSFLPQILILDSERLVQQLRQDLNLHETFNPAETEHAILECISGSLQISSAAKLVLQYNCHYQLPEDLPELFYFDTEKKAELLVKFGLEILKLAELSNLFTRQGDFLYEYLKVVGGAVALSRVDVDTNENLNLHPWTKGYEREYTRPITLPARVHHPRLPVERRYFPDGSKEVFGVRWG